MAKVPGYSGMHKIRPFCFGNIEKKRIIESRVMECNRKQQRSSIFNCNRNISDSDGQESNSTHKKKCSPQADRRVLLAKWKQEQELLKSKLKEKQKPLFKVGIVHHHVASPVFRDISNEKIITRSKNVTKIPPKKGNKPTNKIKKSVAGSVSSKSDDKTAVFNETMLSIGSVQSTGLNKVSPVNVFPFNKGKYDFNFRNLSNKKLTEPHSPSFMHSRRKRTQIIQKPLPRKPLFLTSGGNEDKDDDHLAHRLPDNSSVYELKCTSSSYDQYRVEAVNNNDKPMSLTYNNKELDEEQHKQNLTKNSTVSELECTASTFDQTNKTENIESHNLSCVPSENSSSKSEEIKKKGSKSNANKENESIRPVMDVTQNEYIAGSFDSSGSKKNVAIQTAAKIVVEMSGELENDLAEVELMDEVNCSVITNYENFIISPNITVHRGKRRSRSRKRSISSGMPDVSDDCRIKSPNAVIKERAKFFKNQLDQETGRLLSLADEWEKTSFTKPIPTNVVDEITGIVGQTRLLTRDKFQQFRSLIEQFEDNDGPVKITDNDLAGFWEMIYLQVEQLSRSYDRLHEMQSNNWQEKVAVPVKKRKTVKTARPLAKSRFRDFLQGRKMCAAKAENVLHTETSGSPVTSVCTPTSVSSKQDDSSEANKRYSSSFSPAAYVAMNSSVLGKALGQSPVIIVRSAEGSSTPKSILKKKLSHSISQRKKTVLFGDDFISTDVKSGPEQDSRFQGLIKTEDVRSDSPVNDPLITTGDQMVITNDQITVFDHHRGEASNDPVISSVQVVKTDDRTSESSGVIQMSNLNDQIVTSNDQMLTSDDHLVSANDLAVTVNHATINPDDPLVTANNPLDTTINTLSTNLYTPRRSSRLASKVALSSSKVPFSTTSACSDSNNTVTAEDSLSPPRRSIKKFSLKPSLLSVNPDELIKSDVEKVKMSKNKKSEQSETGCNTETLSSSKVPFSTTSACSYGKSTVTVENSGSAPRRSIKKFSLKPSLLSVNSDELIKSTVEKVNMSKNKKSDKNISEQSQADCSTENKESSFEPSSTTRKSKRLLQRESDAHHTVTFESGSSERKSSHYRKTPYKKCSRKSFSVEEEED